MCRDSKTNLSHGFDFVNFTHCTKCLFLAFILLIGKLMQILLAQNDSALRKSVIGNIIIKGLARDINDFVYTKLFCVLGKSCQEEWCATVTQT